MRSRASARSVSARCSSRCPSSWRAAVELLAHGLELAARLGAVGGAARVGELGFDRFGVRVERVERAARGLELGGELVGVGAGGAELAARVRRAARPASISSASSSRDTGRAPARAPSVRVARVASSSADGRRAPMRRSRVCLRARVLALEQRRFELGDTVAARGERAFELVAFGVGLARSSCFELLDALPDAFELGVARGRARRRASRRSARGRPSGRASPPARPGPGRPRRACARPGPRRGSTGRRRRRRPAGSSGGEAAAGVWPAGT